MCGGLACCLHHFLRIGQQRHTGNILGYGPVEKMHPLGQIADMLTPRGRIILIERRPIQPYLARGRGPRSRQGAGQCGFSRT